MKYIKLFEAYNPFENEFYKEVKYDDIIFTSGNGSTQRDIIVQGRKTHTERISENEEREILSFDENLYVDKLVPGEFSHSSLILNVRQDGIIQNLKNLLMISFTITKLVDEYFILQVTRLDSRSSTHQTYLCDQMEGLEKCIKDSI